MTGPGLPIPLDADGTGTLHVQGEARLRGHLASNGRAWCSPPVRVALVLVAYRRDDVPEGVAFETEPVGTVLLEGPLHAPLDGARVEFVARDGAPGFAFKFEAIVAHRMMPGLHVRWGEGPLRGSTADGLMPPCANCGHRVGRHRRLGHGWRACRDCGCAVA